MQNGAMNWPVTPPGMALPPSAIAAATRPAGLRDCARCGRPFEAARGAGPDALYCGWPCALAESKRLGDLAQRACIRCGRPVPASRELSAVYCSSRCQVLAAQERRLKGAGHRGGPHPGVEPRECDWCGTSYTPARRWGRFCSKRCGQAAVDARRRGYAAPPAARELAMPLTKAERLADLAQDRAIMMQQPLPVFERAACHDHPELPPGAWDGGDSTAGNPLAARAIGACCSCPELLACRAYALSQPADQQFGILGGMTAPQRRAEIRRRRAAASAA